MHLFELAYACRIYSATFDTALDRFRRSVMPRLDPINADHRIHLLRWLNAWGCRQFAIRDHPQASMGILNWSNEHLRHLPDRDAKLEELPDSTLDAVEVAYAALCECTASIRSKAARMYRVNVGPTGAAKILFALWPAAFSPWDDAIREHFELDGSPRSYRTFIQSVVSEQLQTLKTDASRFGIEPDGIAERVGRPNSTLPKLVDEYFLACPPNAQQF